MVYASMTNARDSLSLGAAVLDLLAEASWVAVESAGAGWRPNGFSPELDDDGPG